MNPTETPTILVIVGITGDLSRRYLLPAIERLVKAGVAPERFTIVGVSRRDVSPADVLPEKSHFLAKHLEMFQMNLSEPDDYLKLQQYLDGLAKNWSKPAQRLFYLSIPPQVSQSIITMLGKTCIADTGETKLLLEKPFGTDLASAKELVEQTKKHFKEEQIYRIDHYLAKEMAQNLVVFREANPLFQHTWNGDFIQAVEITVAEKIGIEGRAAFYEQTGALRDVVQSHLLQLAALTLMNGIGEEIPARRLQALKHLHVPAGKPLHDYAVRAQYEGYRQEVGNPDSTVETFVSLNLVSTDPHWTGVPIRLTTGKALHDRLTDIRLTYKTEDGTEPNQLTLQVQPNGGIDFCLWTKAPGYSRKLERQALTYYYKDYFSDLPEAYEQVLLDAINGNRALFTSSDEVLETWRILEPIQKAWAMNSSDLRFYKPGSDVSEVLNQK